MAILLVFLVWLAGLFWFVAESPAKAEKAPAESDAIVVLTGGSERLQEGLNLLRQGKAGTLFVSGVAPGVRLGELLRLSGNAPLWARCCVVLGYKAENTLGNAEETALWMRSKGYKSLLLVTSWYHMPRSLLDFKRAMPQTRISAYPVFSPEIDRRRWWSRESSVLFLAREYSKYLVVLGESFFPLSASRSSAAIEKARGQTPSGQER